MGIRDAFTPDGRHVLVGFVLLVEKMLAGDFFAENGDQRHGIVGFAERFLHLADGGTRSCPWIL